MINLHAPAGSIPEQSRVQIRVEYIRSRACGNERPQGSVIGQTGADQCQDAFFSAQRIAIAGSSKRTITSIFMLPSQVKSSTLYSLSGISIMLL